MVKIDVKTPRGLRRAKRRSFLESLLGGECVNCGATTDLEFDHVFPEDKIFNIGSSHLEYSYEHILPELQKCQLLCHYCHIKKTTTDTVEIKHGTVGAYVNRKCRCGICRAVWYKYTRKYVERYNNTDVETRRKQQSLRSRRYYKRKLLLAQG